MFEDTPQPDVTGRATYRIWGVETVRFSDTDAVGHVNNVSFAAYLETGRTTFGRACGLPIGVQGLGHHIVLARVEIDYRHEVHWPAVLDLGSAVVRLGRSSITLIQGVFIGDLCVATGREVLVMVDSATGRPATLPDELRARLLRDGGQTGANGSTS
ncbi:acyl-CoA thioesterase [Acidisoma sp.]|uniref:acyl-CoA thioesterase n=1 Tax=Acidisoma sp. TaxID=1872115 RepID=UPI003B00E2D4